MSTEEAKANFEALRSNPYPGRGLVVGLDGHGKHMVQVYWIMGRSENSRNRVFSVENGRVFTEAADPSKMTDSSNIIYNAMDAQDGHFVVSNGNQTDAVLGALCMGRSFYEALKKHEYEPDAPNFTPRITAMCSNHGSAVMMAILRKSIWGGSCERHFYSFEHIGNGFGFCLTTYSGDGDPLPSFRGEPLLMPLDGGIEQIGDDYWNALNSENRVALVVKFISINHPGRLLIHIVNRFSKVAQK